MNTRVFLPQLIVAFVMTAGLASARAEDVQLQIHVLKPDGTPATGARAIFRGRDRQKIEVGPPTQTTAVANEQGLVTIAVPRRNSGNLILDVPGCALRVVALRNPLTDLASQKPATLTEKLTPAYSIKGVTTDEKGSSLADVDVAITSERADYALGFQFNAPFQPNALQTPELTTRSKGDGSFSLRGFDFTPGAWLNLPTARIYLLATTRRGGILHACTGGFKWKPKDARTPLKLALYPEETIQGQIVDFNSGQGVPNVKLTVQASPPDQKTSEGLWLRSPSGTPSATTDAQGRFKLAIVPPVAGIQVSLQAPEGFWSSSVSLNTANNRTLPVRHNELKLPLHRVVAVSGQVVDAQAKAPLAPVKIRATVEDELAGVWKSTVQTASYYEEATPIQADGKFQIKAPTGTVKFHVQGSYSGNGSRVYETSSTQTVTPRGMKGLRFDVKRIPSVLLHWPEAPDPRFLSLTRPYLIAQVRSSDGTGTVSEQNNNGPLWQFPVARWGDSLQVRFISRYITQENTTERELLPWSTFVSNPKTATEIHLRQDAFTLPK